MQNSIHCTAQCHKNICVWQSKIREVKVTSKHPIGFEVTKLNTKVTKERLTCSTHTVFNKREIKKLSNYK